MDDELLTRAVVVYIGTGRRSYPWRDEAHLVAEFGADLALELYPAVKQLYDDFYRCGGWRSEPDLRSLGERAVADFRALHPEIGEEAVQALAWCYTFDHK